MRSRAFISYSHNQRDRKYLGELKAFLDYYERTGVIQYWDDTKLQPGSIWFKEIEQALAITKVAILLISQPFLISDFISKKELPELLAAAEKDGATILCIITGPCLFADTKLAQFQAVNVPSKPLSGLSKHEREEIWVQVAKRVRELLEADSDNLGTSDTSQKTVMGQGQADNDWVHVILETFKTITYGPPLSANAEKLLHYLILRIGLFSNNLEPSARIAHDLALNPTEFNDAVEELKRKRCVKVQGEGMYDEYIYSYVEPEPLAWYLVDKEVLGFDVRKDMLAVAQSVVLHERGVTSDVIKMDTGLSPNRINIAALILERQNNINLLMPRVQNGEYYFAEADATYDTREFVKRQTG